MNIRGPTALSDKLLNYQFFSVASVVSRKFPVDEIFEKRHESKDWLYREKQQTRG
jgi:hypothetical protein